MRVEAERLLGMKANFTAVSASAEATTLPSQSIDLITVGQALHRFNPSRTRQEFDRILRANGWLAFMSNRFGPAKEQDFSNFLRVEKCRRFSFHSTMLEALEQFIGGARSAANAPSTGEPGYAEFEHAQRATFDIRSTDGLITIEYVTEVVVGRMDHRSNPSA